MRTLGMLSSMTIITVIFSFLMGGHAVTTATLPAFLQSMHAALLAFCALCVLGIFCSFGRLREKATDAPEETVQIPAESPNVEPDPRRIS
jgi:hypothetical protein